jgi:hypothetical protein
MGYEEGARQTENRRSYKVQITFVDVDQQSGRTALPLHKTLVQTPHHIDMQHALIVLQIPRIGERRLPRRGMPTNELSVKTINHCLLQSCQSANQWRTCTELNQSYRFK